MMIFGERRAFCSWRSPDRCAQRLGKRYCLVPTFPPRDCGAVNQHRRLCLREGLGKLGQTRRVRCDAPAHRPYHGWTVTPHLPITERKREKNGTCWWLKRRRHRPHERSGYILGTNGLIGPFNPRTRKHRSFDVGEPWLHQQHLACLLASGYDDRGLVLERRREVPHCIGGCRRVEIHQGRMACSLRKAV